MLDIRQYAQELEGESGRHFMSGCSLDDDTLSIYVYGPDGSEDFFNHIVELSSELESCSVELEEDYYEDNDYEY